MAEARRGRSGGVCDGRRRGARVAMRRLRIPFPRLRVIAVAVEGRRRRSGGGVGLADRPRRARLPASRAVASSAPLSLQPSPSPTPDSAAPCCLTGRLADNSALDSDTPGTPAQRRLVGRLADNWLALLFKAVELLLAVAMASVSGSAAAWERRGRRDLGAARARSCVGLLPGARVVSLRKAVAPCKEPCPPAWRRVPNWGDDSR